MYIALNKTPIPSFSGPLQVEKLKQEINQILNQFAPFVGNPV